MTLDDYREAAPDVATDDADAQYAWLAREPDAIKGGMLCVCGESVSREDRSHLPCPLLAEEMAHHAARTAL